MQRSLNNKWMDLVLLTSALLIVTMWYSGLNLLVFQPNQLWQETINGLYVEISQPSIVFSGETIDFFVTLENKSGQAIGPVVVILSYGGDQPIVVVQGNSTKMEFGILDIGERQTRTVQLQVRSVLSGFIERQSDLEFVVHLNDGTTSVIPQTGLISNLFPVENVRTISKAIASFLGLWAVWIGKEWWSFRTKDKPNGDSSEREK